jgi:plastocyanin domain-containing protein
MKSIGITLIIIVVVFGGIMLLSLLRGNNSSNGSDGGNVRVNNVSIVDGRQIVKIRAKGGYQPRQSVAKAGVPTAIEFDTNGTFDCSSFIRIPSMGISQSLGSSGTTTIDLGTPVAGKLQGSCGMGMYPFEIVFSN